MRSSLQHPITITLILFAGSGCAASQSSGGHRVGQAVATVSDQEGDPAHNLLKNRDFASGSMLPWLTSFSAPADGTGLVKDGALCVTVKQPGANRWDAQVRHREMVIQKGHEYVVSFKAWASRPTKLAGKIGMSGPPYQDYWSRSLDLQTQPKQFAYKFKMTRDDDATAEFALHFGGHLITGKEPIDVCFDDFVLSDPEFVPPPPPKAALIPKVRVNQLGYVPSFPKHATIVSDAKEPLSFELRDAQGKVVFIGKSVPRGLDADSGDNLHNLDFSAFVTPGKGYVLAVDKETSDAFDIDARIYGQAKYDAFKYFYLNRSGVELKLPFTGKPDWARPAGHPKDEAACSAAAKCDYSLDVTGGWYDAGDYGKYVVNGGISVWTLMNWYERAVAMNGDTQSFGDKKGLLPESGNKIPDVLDEARWELEFLLRMQVPEGKPQAGLVHHKMHDIDWTALGMGPHEGKIKRELRPVSTAATLNLAAVTAQAARLYKPFDPAFAERCLKAAETAYAAAKQHPNLIAPLDDGKGGGAYDDSNVADEFYWAQAELFVTTNKPEYKQELEASPLDAVIDGGGDGVQTLMTWQRVDGLAKISMALVTAKPLLPLREKYRAQLLSVANGYEKLTSQQGYRFPFGLGKSAEYPWGSNSFVVNNALILALAYDFTKQASYRDAAVEGLNYLFGRNAMGQSYISGYGERPLKYPHHRFWAHQCKETGGWPTLTGTWPGGISGDRAGFGGTG